MTAKGTLAANILQFCRALRRAGMNVGTDRALEALRAVDAVGLKHRDDVYWALHTVLVDRREDMPVFAEVFDLFWRDPRAVEELMALLLPTVQAPTQPRPDDTMRRAAEAMARREKLTSPPRPAQHERLEVDVFMAHSTQDVVRDKDFEAMSADEVRRAKLAISQLKLPVPEIVTRRFRPDPRGSAVDMRATLRASLRSAGHHIPLRHRDKRKRPPAWVVLCDISGSMTRYSRMLLHFVHALTNARDRVHSFTFGTRLTPITHMLRQRDVDVALEDASNAVQDWSGGTRIGECLREFNLRWSRRLLGQGAVVLLVTDGLDRADVQVLAHETARLQRSCRRLIWLNPLLRYDGFEPLARGVRAILPHVDQHLPVHNLTSLEQLCAALSGSLHRRGAGKSR